MVMAGVTITHAHNVLVRIEARDGTVGWGEAASAPTMTGDTVESLLAAVRNHLAPGGLFGFEFWQSSAARPAPYLSWFHKAGTEFELVRLDTARYEPRTRLLPIDFQFFVFKGQRVVDRFAETHTVRTFHTEEVRRLLGRSGFRVCWDFGRRNRHSLSLNVSEGSRERNTGGMPRLYR